MNDKTPSPSMLRALSYAEQNGRKLIRYPGGFWAKAGWISGEKSFATLTVHALITRGFLKASRWGMHSNWSYPVEVTLVEKASQP